MQKLLLALVALAGLAGLGLLLFQDSEVAPAAGSPTAEAAARPDERPAPEPVDLEAPAEAADDDALVTRLEAPGPEVEDAARVVAGVGRALTGRVALPAGLPTDERLRVHVQRDQPDGATALRESEPEHVFSVGPDGRFEVELPFVVEGDGQARAWLSLESRYLVSDGPLAVAIGGPEEGEPAEVTFETELGAWITGRIVLPTDADPELGADAVEGLRFRPDPLLGANRRGAARARLLAPVEGTVTDAPGFEIPAVRCVGPGAIELRSEVFASTKVRGVEPEPGEHLEFDVVLVDGATLVGRVVDDDGHPVPEAQVVASVDPVMFGQGGFEVREATTNAEGRFELAHVTPGQVRIAADAEGHLSGTTSVDVLDGERREGLEVELERGNVLAGRVQWPGGAPVEAVTVQARFDLSFAAGMEAINATRGAQGKDVTDAEGAFAIRGMGKGPFVVEAAAEREGRTWSARLDALEPGGDPLLLTLAEPVGVTGLVVDDRGVPLTDFEVIARTRTGGLLAGLGAETERDRFTGEDGSFFLDGLRPGAWELIARADGHARPVPVEVELPLDANQVVELTLPRAATAAGVVLDPNGFPVPEATVGPKIELADIGRMELEGPPPSAETDANGRFTLEGLPAEPVDLVAEAPGFGESAPVTAELTPGGEVTELLLTLRVGGRILGVLLDDDGDPVPERSILCQDPADPTSQRFAQTDENGEFVFADLAPGTYQVMTFGGGELPEGEEGLAAMISGMKLGMAEVREGEDAYVTLGATAADPVEVRGTVLAAGEPVPGAMVTFLADGEGGVEGMKLVTTGADGTFTTTLDHPGSYLMNVQQVSGTGQQQTVELLETIPDVESHELEVELPSGSIHGRVTTSAGEPAAGVRVSLAIDGPVPNGSITGGQYAEITTEDDGTYELRWLRPGSYSVAAGGSFLGGLFGEAGGQSFGRVVRRGLELDAGERLVGVDFELEAPGRVEGRVLDASGAAVADAAIFLRDAEGNVVDRISMIRTDASGRFVYGGLQPGTYEVSARTPEAVTGEPVDVAVRSDEGAEVVLTVDAGTLLLVSLTDREGEPVRCSVTVTGPDGRQVNGLFSYQDLMSLFSKGEFSVTDQRVGPLPPGKYRVEAVAEDGRDARKVVSLTGQEQRRVRLRLD